MSGCERCKRHGIKCPDGCITTTWTPGKWIALGDGGSYDVHSVPQRVDGPLAIGIYRKQDAELMALSKEMAEAILGGRLDVLKAMADKLRTIKEPNG